MAMSSSTASVYNLRSRRSRQELGPETSNTEAHDIDIKASYVTRNLIKNCSGQDGPKASWKVSQNGGAHWKVENKNVGTKAMPEEVLALTNNKWYNFVTSFEWCSKEQVIDLVKEGFTEELLDSQPDIAVSEWYAARYDCGSHYEMSVTLLKNPEEVDENIIAEYSYGPIETPASGEHNHWRKAEHTFSNYGRGLRYIRFVHKGKDAKWWAGHYGSKMAGAQVSVHPREDMLKEEVTEKKTQEVRKRGRQSSSGKGKKKKSSLK